MAKRFLVPLDRDATSESIVPLIASAARDAGGTVRLLQVMPVPGNVQDVDGRTVAFADQEMARLEAEGSDYLRNVAAANLDHVAAECVVRFGEPAVEILREAEAFGADVIAVTTTCRSGVSRQLFGSVAEELIRKAPMTVLVLRPPA